MSFDISLAFDKNKYLNTQAYLFTDTIKDKLPDDTIIHIVTNRGKDDEIRQYMSDNLNTKFYFNNGNDINHLQSRCKYMFNCFKVKTNKPWLVKMELDFLFLKHLSSLDEMIYQYEDNNLDLILEPENRRIFDDKTAHRLWRIIYNAMGMKYPKDTFIEYRENRETGLPLFGTGMIFVKSNLLDKINKRWVPLTEICERWIKYNIHPNEFAFTGLIFDEGWKWWTYEDKYKFNPIGHFRKGMFPSTELVDDCKLPDSTIIFDYHRPQWLFHVAKYNDDIKNYINNSKDKIPKDWWDLTSKDFMENIR